MRITARDGPNRTGTEGSIGFGAGGFGLVTFAGFGGVGVVGATGDGCGPLGPRPIVVRAASRSATALRIAASESPFAFRCASNSARFVSAST